MDPLGTHAIESTFCSSYIFDGGDGPTGISIVALARWDAPREILLARQGLSHLASSRGVL